MTDIMHGAIKAGLLIHARICKEAVIAMKVLGHLSKPVFNDGVTGRPPNIETSKQKMISASISENRVELADSIERLQARRCSTLAQNSSLLH